MNIRENVTALCHMSPPCVCALRRNQEQDQEEEEDVTQFIDFFNLPQYCKAPVPTMCAKYSDKMNEQVLYSQKAKAILAVNKQPAIAIYDTHL